MKVMVTGCRDWDNCEAVKTTLSSINPPISELIVGDANGADSIARAWARDNPKVLLEVFYADWRTYGKSAGPRRNGQMVAMVPDLVLAFWDGHSRGTLDAIKQAVQVGIPVEIIPQ